MKRRRNDLAVLGILALCACSPADKDEAIPAPVPEGVSRTILESDAGKTIELSAGTRFAVALSGIPTAGYVWAPSEAPAFVTPAGTASGPTHEMQNQPGFTGGNHWEVFLFEVTGCGHGALKFEQRRPWESDEPPSGSFAVDLDVRQ